MALANKAFNDLNEQDLLDLITLGVPESRSIEYKLQIPGNSDGEKKEFLADISSFANSSGGFLVYGVDESQGLPTSLPGIAGIDTDREILRLESIIQSGLAPRIPGLFIRSILLSNGAAAILIKVAKSWASPHMVTLGGTSRFYSRNSAGKYQLDVYEIRSAVLATEALSNRIKDFCLDRVNKVIVGDTPVPLPDGAKVILHLIPINYFLSSHPINLAFAEENYYRLSNLSSPNYSSPSSFRINIDGIVTFMVSRDESNLSYTQLFRDGSIEAVSHFLLSKERDGQCLIPSIYFEQAIMDNCSRLLGFQRASGIEPPVVIFLTLAGVKGYQMGVSQGVLFQMMPRIANRIIDREIIQSPDVLIENYEGVDLPALLRPIFDSVWNAAGWVGSINYDERGNWSDKRQRG